MSNFYKWFIDFIDNLRKLKGRIGERNFLKFWEDWNEIGENPGYSWQYILGLIANFHYFGTNSNIGEIVVGGWGE